MDITTQTDSATPVAPLMAQDTQPADMPTEPQAPQRWLNANGVEYLMLDPDELADYNTRYAQEIRDAELGHASLLERVARNERAYEALVEPTAASGDKPMVVLPLIQRDCDQTSAWFINAILRPHPIYSFDPEFPEVYQLPIEDPTMGTYVLPTTAEEVAATLEHGVECLLRGRQKFRRLVSTVINETVRGRGPAIVKCVYDESTHTQFSTMVSQGALNTPQWQPRTPVESSRGDRIKMYAIPVENFLMPADEEEIATSPWVLEKLVYAEKQLKKELQKPGCLIQDDRIAEVIAAKGDYVAPSLKEAKATVDGRISKTPSNRYRVDEVWFEEEVDGEEVKLQGMFHYGLGEFLWIARNSYNHQSAPYVAFFQKKRPFRFSDKSTCESLVQIQTIISEILHLALQNAIIANSSPIVADPSSEAFDWISKNDIGSDSLIPGHPDEVQRLDFGREQRTLMPEVNWLVEFERSVSGVSTFEDGSNIPGRTSPNTVQQILTSGSQVPMSQLADYGDAFCDLIRLYLKTYKQFQPTGELLYVTDPKTKAMLEVAFRLPDEAALDNFRISLTAADEAEAAEAAVDQLTMLANLLDQDAEIVAKIIGPIANVGVPDGLSAVLERLIERKQEILSLIIDKIRTDTDRLVVTKDLLRSVLAEKQLVKQQMEAQQAAAAGAPQGGQQDGNPNVPPPAPPGQAPGSGGIPPGS